MPATYDALSRPVATTLPNGTVTRSSYDRLGRIVQISAALANGQSPTQYIRDVQHNAKGQQISIVYGNGCKATFRYDPLTSRLQSLVSRRDPAQFPTDDPQSPVWGWPGSQIQNLNYFYDASGNISGIRDDAQQIVFFRGVKVEPSQDFTYDSFSRLVQATGREYLSATYDAFDSSTTNLPHPNDGNAMGRYVENYVYDLVDNILSFRHIGSSAS